QGEERLPIERLVDHAEAAAHHGASLAIHVPREAQPWGKVVVVAIEGRANSLPDLQKTARRVEVAQQIAPVFYYCVQLVTQSKVQGERPGSAPVVLNESGVSPVMDMSRGVAHKLTCFGRHPGEKVFQPGGTVSDSPGRPSYEFDSTPRPAVGAAIEGVAMELSTKLDCVVTAGIRHVIYKLIPVVRALYLGP